jgi:primary-amine oxidase
MRDFFAVIWGCFFVSLSALAEVHPLVDLSAEEIDSTVKIVKTSGKFTPNARFAILTLKEPKKSVMLKYDAESPVHVQPVDREAFVLLFEVKDNRVFEVSVNLKSKKITESKEVKGLQPPILLEEFERLDRIIHEDARWREAIKKRGIDVEDVYVDGWAPGLMSPQERKKGARLMRGLSYLKGKNKTFYTRPIEGLVVTVDMNSNAITEVWDSESPKTAFGPRELGVKATPNLSANLTPLVEKRPSGVSYKISGQQVTWDNWSFRFRMHPMKGLMVYDVRYKDKGKERKILYKGTLSEMVVPYGDKDKTWAFRNAFDVNEYGLGRTAHTLELEKDVPSHATLLSSVFADDLGRTMELKDSVAIYERDGGLLWKHMDQPTRESETRRGRDLYLTFTTTIGNYDYGINWIFKQDASIEVEAFLTGIMLAKGSVVETNPCEHECTHLVEPRIVAPNHQHFFAFRLDFDVDGAANTPVQVDTRAIPAGKNNALLGAFEAFPTYLNSEKKAVGDMNLASARKWKIINRDAKNSLGHPTGYLLSPGESAISYLQANSPIRMRAKFLDHHVWFTQYHDEEQSAAGEYPNQNFSGDGVNKWIMNNESLDQKDVVLWYVFGVTHVTRPEEWPVMNVHRTGFKLLPVNFFSSNPAASL